jgi:hypothetical protein
MDRHAVRDQIATYPATQKINDLGTAVLFVMRKQGSGQ